MLHPAAPTDLLAQLRAHVSQALALLDGVAIAVHPAASLAPRRWTNRTGYALQAARRELRRLVVLLEQR
jgi:predicted metallo-beta-lactamase superfamily hydrolase